MRVVSVGLKYWMIMRKFEFKCDKYKFELKDET